MNIIKGRDDAEDYKNVGMVQKEGIIKGRDGAREHYKREGL